MVDGLRDVAAECAGVAGQRLPRRFVFRFGVLGAASLCGQASADIVEHRPVDSAGHGSLLQDAFDSIVLGPRPSQVVRLLVDQTEIEV